MKNRWISAGVLAAMLMALTLVLSGCFFRSPEELYQSPERSADYENLTQKIREVKGKLAQEYGVTEVEDTSVLSGDNTALIQLQDMDGDGQRETAVTFSVCLAQRSLRRFFSLPKVKMTSTLSAPCWREMAPPFIGWTMQTWTAAATKKLWSAGR